MNETILVTGGCGFVGANLVPLLQKEGYQVKVLDNFSRGYSNYLEGTNAEIIEGDIRNPEDISSAIQGCDSVIHLAAFGSVVESVSEPFENFEVNAHGTLNMLNESVKNNISKFIFSSTGGALIGEAQPPVNEDSPPRPISPYGASKLCGEAYCSAFAGSYNLNTISLRFANLYGPFSAHKKGAATNFMKAALKDEQPQIFGDGSATRDFLHVDDLCNGILKALTTEVEPGSVFHIASGRETSIKTLAEKILDAAGRPDLEIEYNPKRKGEVESNFAIYDLANKILGFEPEIPLEEGLKRTWGWFKENEKEVFKYEASDS